MIIILGYIFIIALAFLNVIRDWGEKMYVIFSIMCLPFYLLVVSGGEVYRGLRNINWFEYIKNLLKRKNKIQKHLCPVCLEKVKKGVYR